MTNLTIRKTLLWFAMASTATLLHAASTESHPSPNDYTIFLTRTKAAKRVDVVSSGGGYFPVLIRLDNGDLLAVLRGGATHIGVKGRLDLARSTDNGNTWTVQKLVESDMDARNPAVGQLRDGTILVSYIVDRSYGPDGTRAHENLFRDGLYTIRSTDHGTNWSDPIKSEIPRPLGGSPYGKIIQLPDGTVLLNVYYERGPNLNHETSMIYRSHDGGKTWGDPSMIADNFNETGLLYLPNGRLLAMARAHTGQYLSLCYSSDKGRTWTAPRQITGDNEHPADVILLHDKRLLLVHGERNRPFGVRARLSSDFGKTWGDPIILASDAHRSDCGYPSSVETSPGKVVTIYYGVNETVQRASKLSALDGVSYDRLTAPLSGAYGRAVLWEPPAR